MSMTYGAELIAAFQKARNLTNAGLGKQAGVTGVTIANIKRDGRCSLDTLTKLRKVRGLGCLQPEHFTNGGAQ